MDVNNIIEILLENSEEKYKIFNKKLIPNNPYILGVRVPFIKNLAKKIAKENWQEFLSLPVGKYHEERLLRGFVIGALKLSFEEVLEYINAFLPFINNWAICDSFCAALKITKLYKEKMLDFISTTLQSDKEYYLRFSCVMLMTYYINDEYIDHTLLCLKNVKSDFYYTEMAVAWALSVCYVKYPQKAMLVINSGEISNFTYKTSIRKIKESRIAQKI